MGKVIAVVLLLAACLVGQLPTAKFEYRGSGCGWFAYSGNDLRVTHPPVIGKWVEFATSIPPVGVDYLDFGSLDVGFPLPRGCTLRAYAFPAPIRVWIPWQPTQRFAIPNDPALAGYVMYVQQLNWQNFNGTTNVDIWDVSRGVKLTFGY